MAAKRLYLHIGTHKTGTTSFRASLRANAKILEKRGFHAFGQPGKKRGFFRKRRKRYNLSKLALGFLRPELATISRFRSNSLNPKPAAQARLLAGFLRQLRAITADRVIVSSEGLTFLRTPEEKAELRKFLDALGREVTIILVLRDEAGWRASWNNQLRKLPKVWQGTQALPEMQRANGEWYFDRQAIIDFWSDLGVLVCVDYNATLAAEGNVIPAIYRAMEVDPDGLKLNFETNRRVNLDDDDD